MADELEAYYLCRDVSVVHRQTCHAGFQVETPRPRGAGVQHEPVPCAFHERLVRVAVDNDIRFVAREQLVGCGASELVPVADVDGAPLEGQVDRRGETRLPRRVT